MDNLQYFDMVVDEFLYRLSFKPYYKWITFNTDDDYLIRNADFNLEVLNLIING